MFFYSTNKLSEIVSFQEAIFRGLPQDNGLYMPMVIPKIASEFWDNIQDYSLNEIAFQITKSLLSDELPEIVMKKIIDDALNFEVPIRKINESIFCLELFHGPSMAFKDFGARFMAAVMSYYLEKTKKKINILVATSGDTGGAVAQGFYKKSNITVTILYPKGNVSEIQEKQLTTLGENIKAIEIDGTFDDCQAIVKKAFLDEDLKNRLNLASANSINIARLIPQAFYYAYAYAKLKKFGKEIVFSVPSGNFGNLCAGLLVYKMGMPVKNFIAATNVNNVVPNYLLTGEFIPISPSISTISNAMDVGNPSNFPRIFELFDGNLEKIKEMISGFYYDDIQTKNAVKTLYDEYDYLTCPHSAIGYLALNDYLNRPENQNKIGVFLSTAHYAKFLPEMEKIISKKLIIPNQLSILLKRSKNATPLKNDFEAFKEYCFQNLD